MNIKIIIHFLNSCLSALMLVANNGESITSEDKHRIKDQLKKIDDYLNYNL